jgi:2'-5' RNA ligase
MTDPLPGHTVLQLPVPELEPFVRDRHRHYDRAFVSPDPDFTHAHITALGPFLDPAEIDDRIAAQVAELMVGVQPFTFTLERIETFPDGIIHLRPDPEGPFSDLTRNLSEAFTTCPPYGGRYGEVVPHLTLDLRSEAVTEDSVRTALGPVLPATCRADRLDLAWYEQHGCRLLRSWPLGATG